MSQYIITVEDLDRLDIRQLTVEARDEHDAYQKALDLIDQQQPGGEAIVEHIELVRR